MIEAVIFDMDGLMIDSEPIHSKAFAAVSREYGKELVARPSGLIQIAGLRESENWEEIMKTNGFSEDIGVLTAKRTRIYAKLLLEGVKMQPGLKALLDLLQSHRIKLAVGSSNQIENIDIALNTLDIRNFFDAVISGCSVARSKPFPDIFLKAAKALNAEPPDCVVLEDAHLGVLAGKAAGMKVIAVPNKYTEEQDFSAADLIVSSLEEVNWEKLNGLFVD